MSLRLSFRTGSRSGDTLVFAKPYITIGRHPHSDVRFGPDGDLEVSSRHAAIVARDGLWLLRDLGSTNGTFVNGTRLRGDHVLVERDVILLGRGGPALELHEVPRYTPPEHEMPVVPTDLAPPGLTYRPPRPTVAAGAPPPEPGTLDLTHRAPRVGTVLLVAAAAVAVIAGCLAWILRAGAR